MIDQLSKHPSNIAQSALEYLETLQVAEKTRKKYFWATLSPVAM